MNNTLKILVIIGGLLQGAATFAQFKEYPDHKVIIDIRDSNHYIIPGGACGGSNWEGNGPYSHECKVQSGGLVEIVASPQIFCSYKEDMSGGHLTLVARQGKNCDKIHHEIAHEGNNVRLIVTGQVKPATVNITAGPFEYKVDATSQASCPPEIRPNSADSCTIKNLNELAASQQLFTFSRYVGTTFQDKCTIAGSFVADKLELTTSSCPQGYKIINNSQIDLP